MDQRITIKIAEKEYTLKAATPEQEELIRKAAASVNKKLAAYANKFVSRPQSDLVAFVALNESIGSFTLQKKIESLNEEVSALQDATDSYLKNIM